MGSKDLHWWMGIDFYLSDMNSVILRSPSLRGKYGEMSGDKLGIVLWRSIFDCRTRNSATPILPEVVLFQLWLVKPEQTIFFDLQSKRRISLQ